MGGGGLCKRNEIQRLDSYSQKPTPHDTHGSTTFPPLISGFLRLSGRGGRAEENRKWGGGSGRRVSKQNHDSAEKYRWLLVLPLQHGAAPHLSSMSSFVKLPDVSQRSVTSSVTHQMAMQISSVTVQKDDSVQLLKQTPSRHSGLDASHHLHRLELRWLKDWTTRGSPAGETHTETTLQPTATTLELPATLSDHKHNDRRRNKTFLQAFANVRRR